MKNFHSNGKLLLTGEYVVLDGANALALPTKRGQSLKIEPIQQPILHWKSENEKEEIWFETKFELKNKNSKDKIFQVSNKKGNDQTHNKIYNRLFSILKEAHKLNPLVLGQARGIMATSTLEFPQNWGLGSSSTLINNIAQWFKIDAYSLLQNTFGGSGFDIAAARNNAPITFHLSKLGRNVFTAAFNPKFRDELFFVHLNRKQDSREAIAHYKRQPREQLSEIIEKISSITHQIITCESITEFELLLEIHETLISKVINIPKIKSSSFPDYPRAIKSLGGWGGDFILATGGEKEKEYFRKKGFNTILEYEEMVL
ncbi:MAG TPA: GYDIA family GHMP kinase [Salinimicrobium sp.]|nr:GYDIA family GHMP kinase [Salinimicrobium sp.]